MLRPRSHHLSRHRITDNCCELDHEELDYGTAASRFYLNLTVAMRDCCLDDLRRDYPELDFSRKCGKKEKGHDFAEGSGRGWWTYADWRKTANNHTGSTFS